MTVAGPGPLPFDDLAVDAGQAYKELSVLSSVDLAVGAGKAYTVLQTRKPPLWIRRDLYEVETGRFEIYRYVCDAHPEPC
jgi:hypothetical protein